MNFFEQVDLLKIAEKHIRRIVGLEMEQSRNLQKHYVEARKRIRARLLSIKKGSFTEAQLKIVLIQVETALREISPLLGQEVVFGSQMAAEQSNDDLTKELNLFEKKFNGITQPIPLEIVIESMNKENLLVSQFQSSLNAYNSDLRTKIQRELTQALIMKMPYQMVIEKVNHGLMIEEWKVARIVRTELHNIYNVSKIKGMRQLKEKTYPDLKKAMIHPMDARTGEDSKILAKKNPIIDIDKTFSYTLHGKKYEFFAPPNRPNDRAILIPYRKSWEKDSIFWA